MNIAGGGVADATKPDDLMHLVAGGLTANGFDVRLPDCPDGCRMTIECATARCALAVDEWGGVEWECRPPAGSQADPAQVAGLVALLLAGDVPDGPAREVRRGGDGVTFKGAVGLALKAWGFAVDLAVYPDVECFDVHAEIVVTKDGTDAQVFVTDGGSITWLRDYWAEAATIVQEPEYHEWIADPAPVANSVVDTITRAMHQVVPVDQRDS